MHTIQSEAEDIAPGLLIGYCERPKECELIKSGHTFRFLAVTGHVGLSVYL